MTVVTNALAVLSDSEGGDAGQADTSPSASEGEASRQPSTLKNKVEDSKRDRTQQVQATEDEALKTLNRREEFGCMRSIGVRFGSQQRVLTRHGARGEKRTLSGALRAVSTREFVRKHISFGVTLVRRVSAPIVRELLFFQSVFWPKTKTTHRTNNSEPNNTEYTVDAVAQQK